MVKFISSLQNSNPIISAEFFISSGIKSSETNSLWSVLWHGHLKKRLSLGGSDTKGFQ